MGLAVLAGLLSAAESPPSPNIVFILADDWGWGDLGCYGNKIIKTPHLNRLARQGTLFTQYYVNGSVCSPTRAAILTGRFPARDRIHGHLATRDLNRRRGMPNELSPDLPTLADALKQAGYATGHYGKWHLSDAEGPQPDQYGFQEWRITGRNWDLWGAQLRPHSSALIVDEAIGFMERHKATPFYVNVWLLDTHATLAPTETQLAPYRNLTEPNVRFHSAAQIYCAAATDADAQIGRLLAKLDDAGLATNTLVVFTSDNGPEDTAIRNANHSGVGSAGPLRGRKRSLYEGGVRVPFIARWPAALPRGNVNDTVLSGVDLLPTFCQLTGAKVPANFDGDGEDLSLVFRGQPKSRTRPLLWEWRFRIVGHVSNISPVLAIRDGAWKLLLNADRSRLELYDVAANPMELDNVASQHPEVVERLAARALAWQKTLPEGPFDPGAGDNTYPWPKDLKPDDAP